MRRSYKQLTEGKLNRIALVTQKDKFAGDIIIMLLFNNNSIFYYLL